MYHQQALGCALLLSLSLPFITEAGTRSETGRRRIDIDVKRQNEVVDHTRVVLNEARSESYEPECDSGKFMSMDAEVAAQIYTIDAEGNQYSINERPVGDGIIPLGIWVGKAGMFTFEPTRLECDLLLVDLLLGESHYLSDGPYEFSSQRGTFHSRFVLHVPHFGDIDGNGIVDATDAALLVEHLLNRTPAGIDLHRADMNGDGRVSVADVVSILSK